LSKVSDALLLRYLKTSRSCAWLDTPSTLIQNMSLLQDYKTMFVSEYNYIRSYKV